MSQGTATKAGARIVERRLRNGMRVLAVERHGAPVVSVLLYYRVGVRDEPEHQAGISHFLEHMMFKGTPKYGKGEVDLLTTRLGGSNNAFTGYDHTAYWFEFASDRWELALELEADRMRGLTLDPGEFEAEKAVVLEELAMGEDDPWRALTREVALSLFPAHAYGRPVIGYDHTLRALQPEDMRAYHARHYRPENALLVVCGDLRERSALQKIRQHFGELPGPASRTEASVPHWPVEEPRCAKRVTCRWDDEARRLCMAWPTVPVGSPEDWVFDLVTVVLASGRLSRLFRRLVQEEGLATSVSMSNDTRVDGGGLWLYAECAAGVEPDALEAAIDEELERLASELVPARELARARAILNASQAHEAETVTDLAEDLGGYGIDADWRLSVEASERLAGVRPRDLRKAARRFLGPERRVTGWSLPASGA